MNLKVVENLKYIFKYHLIFLLSGSYCIGILTFHTPVIALILVLLLTVTGVIFFARSGLSGFIFILVVLFLLFCFGMARTYLINNSTYQYDDHIKIDIKAKIINRPEYTGSRYRFFVKILSDKYKNKHLIVTWPAKNNYDLDYGNIIKLSGYLDVPEPPGNPGQFDYQEYLKRQGFYALFRAEDVHFIKNSISNPIKKAAVNIKKKILLINKNTLIYPYSDLYTGLVFGDDGTKLPEEMSDSFQKTGLIHLLVVSGSQVALLSGTLLSIFRCLGLNYAYSFLMISVCNIFFYFITGGGASILRAIIMNEIALGTKLMKRNTDIYHIIALTAFIMLLINPLDISNTGAQLSFIATFSLLFGVPAIVSLFPAAIPRIVKETIAVSVVPFIFTTPLLWYVFHNISPVSILSNLIVINWIEVLVITGFFSTITGFIFLPLAQVINNFSLLLMKVLDKVVDFLSILPYASINVAPPAPWIIIFLYCLIFMVFTGLAKKKFVYIKNGLSGFLFLMLILFLPGIFRKKYLKVTFLDVGQGDSILIETPSRKTVLIDAGGQVRDFRTGDIIYDAGRSVIMPVLRYKGINKISTALVTHFHFDHMGGLPYLISNIPIKNLLDNGNYIRSCSNYYNTVSKYGYERIRAEAAQVINLGKNIKLTIFYPFNKPSSENSHNYFHDNENNNSIVAKLSYKEIDFLFAGDLEAVKEDVLVEVYRSMLESEVLKVSHHGSRTSSSRGFLNEVRPLFAVISVGKNNRFYHPSKSVVKRLENRGVKILRTDRQGAIEFITDGTGLLYKTYK
ncbi:MAG: DNA internalization-related competence protein ComEC/Rec2 [bacterium]|nr:DNA internalization-related competence protein ComEC/Rec2 [bacterium]